jgi:hypothetical protein
MIGLIDPLEIEVEWGFACLLRAPICGEGWDFLAGNECPHIEIFCKKRDIFGEA